MQLEDRRAATPRRAVLRGMMASALAATGALSPRTAFTQTSSIAPFTYHAPQSALDDLKQRLARTRWPEHETANDWSQGAPLAKLRPLMDYWRTGYDWRRCERPSTASRNIAPRSTGSESTSCTSARLTRTPCRFSSPTAGPAR